MANVYESVLSSGGPTPAIITPSNANPAAMAADGIYQAAAAGYAIESIGSVTPSDSTPVELTAGGIYKPTAGGFLYQSNNLKKVVTGELDITSNVIIPTGLDNINVFMLHAYSNKSYGESMQFFLRYEATFGNNFYYLSRYASNGSTGYGAFTNTQLVTCPVIDNITNGNVSILQASNANWQNIHAKVFAW